MNIMIIKSEAKSIVFILAFKIFFIQQISAHILRLSCLTYGNFSIVKSESRLTSNVLETFNDLSGDECEDKCLNHRLCKSINMKNSNGVNCELNSKSTEDPFDDVKSTEAIGWTYKTTDYKARNIGPYCEEKDPCINPFSTTCVDTCYVPGYECQKTTTTEFKHCQEAYKQGYRRSGIYPLHINRALFFDAPCDMETDGGGWIVFQRRVDASVNFDRNWDEYKAGFGNLNGNFWLGLEKIHKLAGPGKGAILRIDIMHMDYSNRLYAEYQTFSVDNEWNRYEISPSSYSGNASDSFHNYWARFTTRDRDNDNDYYINRAARHMGGWWYRYSPYSSLNSLYPMDNRTFDVYMTWYSLNNEYGKVTFSEMKIKYRNAYL